MFSLKLRHRSVKLAGEKLASLKSWLAIVGLTVLGAAALFLHWNPWSGHGTSLNSDSMIPVMLANDRTFDAFRLYYYGQDRFGSWPYVLLRILVRDGFHHPLSAADVFAWQVFFLASSAIPFAILSGISVLTATLWYFFVFVANDVLAVHFLDMAQCYSWQLAGFFWIWFFVRRFSTARTRWQRSLFAGLAILLGSLNAWISVQTVVLLPVIVLGEFFQFTERTRTRRFLVFGALLCLVPSLFHVVLQHIYHTYLDTVVKAIFDGSYRTDLEFNMSEIPRTFYYMLSSYRETPWMAAIYFSAASVLALVYQSVRFICKRDRGATFMMTVRPFVFVITLALGSLALLVSSSASNWVRSNGADVRYASFGLFLQVLSVVSLGAWLPSMTRRSLRLPRTFLNALLFAVVAGTAFATLRNHPPLAGDALTWADEIGRRWPGIIVLGEYWGTYVVGGYSPESEFDPLPTGSVRIPFALARFRTIDKVLVCHYRNDIFGDPASPVPTKVYRGRTLHLVEKQVLQHGEFVFSLYRVE